MSDRLHNAPLVSDRRAVRSRRQLWQALLGLLQDHDWAEINVQMICDRADVARSTFYAHFPTKQDLLDTGFGFGLAEVEHLAAEMAHRPGSLPTLHWLVDHLASAQELERRLQGSAAGHAIMARFRAMTTDLLRRDLTRAGHTTSDQDLTFAIGGLFATLDDWLASGCREGQPALIQRLQGQMLRVLGR